MSTVVLFEEITETVKVPQYAASSSNTPAECLADVLGQCPELVKLELQGNNIQSRGAHGLAGELAQCTALAHLNLRNSMIRPKVDGLTGILGQCSALTHLDLSQNNIGPSYETRLRASWCGEASGLLFWHMLPADRQVMRAW